MNETIDIMMNHRSIRKYTEEPVKKEDLQAILQAAIHGPSSVNGQQWSMILIRDPEKREKIAAWSGDQDWIRQAPEFIIFLMDFYKISQQLEAQGLDFKNADTIESTMVGSVDVGIAFANAMTAAESLGYGIVPIGAVRKEAEEIAKLLGLPPYVYPVLGMCLGRPAEEPGQKPRMPEEAYVFVDEYEKDLKDLIDSYDETMRAYMEERTGGQDVRSWTDTVSYVYSQIYFPKVKASLEKQGFPNNK